MAKENLFLKKAHEMGLLDERDIAVVADITCTNGNSGRAWVFQNGSKLFLYEMRGLADMGELVEVLDLSKAVHLKSSAFILNTHITLTYGGYTYKFKNFAQSKRVIECIREACLG